MKRTIIRVLFWAVLLASATASQLYNSTRFQELQTEINKLKTQSSDIKVERHSEPVEKKRRKK